MGESPAPQLALPTEEEMMPSGISVMEVCRVCNRFEWFQFDQGLLVCQHCKTPKKKANWKLHAAIGAFIVGWTLLNRFFLR